MRSPAGDLGGVGRDDRLCVGLAYVRASDDAVINADWVKAGSYEVNVGGQLHPVAVSLKPLYDPTNERIRP